MTAILPIHQYPRIRGGLETVLLPLVGRDGEVLTEAEWAKGVTWTNNAETDLFVAGFGGGSFGVYEDDDVKPESPNPDDETFYPATLGALYSCQMNAPGGTLGDVSAQRARAALERGTFSKLAQILYTGEAYPCGAPDGSEPNLGLIEAAGLSNAGVATSIRGVFEALLSNVCQTWDTDPVFLIPREFMAYFLGDVVKWDEATESFRFGPHRVAFDCFPNVAPANGGADTDPGDVWVYAILPPRAAVSEQINVTPARRELENKHTVRAERQAIIAFDSSTVVAAKAQVS